MIRSRSLIVVTLIPVASTLVVALAACGGGGPSDLNLTASPPVTVTTPKPTTTTSSFIRPPVTRPAVESLVARAKGPRIAVYRAPRAQLPLRRLAGAQVFLVTAQRPGGWLNVVIPTPPFDTSVWIRAADVTITRVTFRIRVELGAHRITVFRRGRQIYRGPIAVGASDRSAFGPYYVRKLVAAPKSHTTSSPYSYALIKRLADQIPLGTPVDIVA